MSSRRSSALERPVGKCSTALVDFEWRVKQRSGPTSIEPPKAERPQAAHRAPMGLVEHSGGQSEGRPCTLRVAHPAVRRHRPRQTAGRARYRHRAKACPIRSSSARRACAIAPTGSHRSAASTLVGIRPRCGLQTASIPLCREGLLLEILAPFLRLRVPFQLRKHALQFIPEGERTFPRTAVMRSPPPEADTARRSGCPTSYPASAGSARHPLPRATDNFLA